MCVDEHRESEVDPCDSITLTIGCAPKAQPRIRARVVQPKRAGARAFASFYTPKTADAFRSEVVLRARGHDGFPREPWTGPIAFSLDVYFERPRRLQRRSDPDGPIRHVAKPDCDNLKKAVMDALTDAGLWVDDCQVCQWGGSKWYAAKGCQAGAIITITRIADPC